LKIISLSDQVVLDIVNDLAIIRIRIFICHPRYSSFSCVLCAHIASPLSFSHSLSNIIHHRNCCTLAILCNIKTTSGPSYPSFASSLLPTTVSLIKLCNRGNPVFSVLDKKGEANCQSSFKCKGTYIDKHL
jgi:hypothetical protein